MPGYISPPVPAMAAGGPSRCPRVWTPTLPEGEATGWMRDPTRWPVPGPGHPGLPLPLVFCVLPFCILREDLIL